MGLEDDVDGPNPVPGGDDAGPPADVENGALGERRNNRRADPALAAREAATVDPDTLASVTYFCAASSDCHRPWRFRASQLTPEAAAADAPPLLPECSVIPSAENPACRIYLRMSRTPVS